MKRFQNIYEYDADRIADDLAFSLSTSYPRGGNTMTLRAGSARECQQWMKAIADARYACVEAEKRHVRRQSRASKALSEGYAMGAGSA